MAIDPNQLLQSLIGTTGLSSGIMQNAQDSALAQQQAQQNLALGGQQQQLNDQTIAANNAKAGNDAQYQADVSKWVQGGGKAQGLSNLIAAHPEKYEALQAGWKIKNDAQHTADLGYFGNVHGALNNNRPDLAAETIDQRVRAEAAAGMDTTEDMDWLNAIRSGDKSAINTVKAYSLAQIAAATGPDKFADTYGTVAKSGDKTHVVSAGGALVDDDGKELYKAAQAPTDALQVPIFDGSGKRVGTQLVANGGRDGGAGAGGAAGASAGSAGAGQTAHGWTPRGPNSDAAVDGKNAGMVKTLGIALTDPFPAGMSNMQIAQALTESEGGPGSLADRNNNPANLTDPRTGGYRTFSTKQAGLVAAAAQVARNRARGQNTIQTMVEGLPIAGGGGSAGAPAGGAKPGYFGPQGGASDDGPAIQPGNIASVPAPMRAAVQAIAEGRAAAPRAGTRNGEALLDAVTAYDPTFDAANATTRLKTRVDFTSGKSAVAVNSLNTAMGHLIHMDNQVEDLGNVGVMGGLINPLRRSVQNGVLGRSQYSTFDQTKRAAAAEMRKVFAGSSGGNLTELEGWEKSFDSAASPTQLHDAIKNGVDLMGSRLSALQDQYSQGMNRSDRTPQFIKPSIALQAKQRFGIDLGNATATTPQGGALPRVSTLTQAMALPKGTRFIDPNGKVRTR